MKIPAAVVAVLLTVSAVAHAAAPATFILSNGQRESGTLVYGRGDNNIVDLKFHLMVGGNDRSWAMDEVAAIDFTGSAPSQSELSALPSGGTSVMVLRNGTTVRGRLHNIIGGDQVQWVPEGGQRRNYPISEVSRLYLKPDAARSAYGGQAPQPTATGGSFGVPGGPVSVDARQGWVTSGVRVMRGDRLRITATGEVNLGNNVTAGPNGAQSTATGTRSRMPANGVPPGALIGRIGSSAPFGIGANNDTFVAPETGMLMLSVNDDQLSDNSGAFSVTIDKR